MMQLVFPDLAPRSLDCPVPGAAPDANEARQIASNLPAPGPAAVPAGAPINAQGEEINQQPNRLASVPSTIIHTTMRTIPPTMFTK